MTVTLNYLNGLVDKAGCMDANIEVHNVARITNVFAQRLELWSSRSMGRTSSVTFQWGAGNGTFYDSNPELSQRIGRLDRVYGCTY